MYKRYNYPSCDQLYNSIELCTRGLIKSYVGCVSRQNPESPQANNGLTPSPRPRFFVIGQCKSPYTDYSLTMFNRSLCPVRCCNLHQIYYVSPYMRVLFRLVLLSNDTTDIRIDIRAYILPSCIPRILFVVRFL